MLKIDLYPLLPAKHIAASCACLMAAAVLSAELFSASASAQALPQTIDVHTARTKKFVGRVQADIKRIPIASQGSWSIVRFAEPAVPVWVSEQFVVPNGSDVTVATDHLNARIQPSLDSPVVRQLAGGYISRSLSRRNGFVQILAPQDWSFAIKENGLVSRPQLTAEEDKTLVAGEEKTVVAEAADFSGPVVDEPTGEEAAEPNPDFAELHKISPGDKISLLVFGEQDLSAAGVRVPSSGSVSFPLIGSTVVAGKTTAEIEKVIAAKLAGGYIRNPRLSVTIDAYRPIFIRGAVQETGAFPYTEGLTVAKALAVAGGMKNSGKADSISILREGNTVQTALSADSQYQVRPGDIITVDEEVGVSEEPNFYVYLHGEVKQPGEYVYRRGLTVEKAVVLAGGFTLRASKRKISVSRAIEGQNEPEKLSRVELHLPVQPGDIINVGASWF